MIGYNAISARTRANTDKSNTIPKPPLNFSTSRSSPSRIFCGDYCSLADEMPFRQSASFRTSPRQKKVLHIYLALPTSKSFSFLSITIRPTFLYRMKGANTQTLLFQLFNWFPSLHALFPSRPSKTDSNPLHRSSREHGASLSVVKRKKIEIPHGTGCTGKTRSIFFGCNP